MLNLRISVHEFKTVDGAFLGMNAGEYTGLFAPLPADEETRKGMEAEVLRRAEYLLGLPDDAPVPEDCAFTLAEIKESIRENIIHTKCENGELSCPDCDGSGKCEG